MKAFLALALTALLTTGALAQGKSGLDNPTVPIAPASTPQPSATTLDSTGIPGATDSTPLGSPVPATPRGYAIKAGGTVAMQLTRTVDSGSFKNGDAIYGTLTAPLKTTAGTTLRAGTNVVGTVVSAAKAGTVQSGGILSLQLTRVGAVPIVTDVVDFNGQEGHKDVADSAPQKGSEAVAQAGATLQFHVLQNGPVPGVIPGAKLPGKGPGNPGTPAAGSSTGQPNLGPGVNQTPINGGSQAPVGSNPLPNPKQ